MGLDKVSKMTMNKKGPRVTAAVAAFTGNSPLIPTSGASLDVAFEHLLVG